MDNHRFNTALIGLIFIFIAVIVFGLFWFFFLGPDTPVGLGWYLLSFAAGLTMIVLPCTLQLAFVIVTLSKGKIMVERAPPRRLTRRKTLTKRRPGSAKRPKMR